MATIRKRGDYQWQVIIRKRGYPEQSKTFNTKPEAVTWAGHVESEMARGVYISTGEAERTTLAVALEKYWLEISSKKRHPEQERRRINKWLEHPLAQYYLSALRGSDFAKHRDARRAQGRAENTIRLELAIISHLFEIARKEWGMEGLVNPLNNIRKPSGSRARDRRLRPGEFYKIYKYLRRCNNLFAAAAFVLAIETSLRQGMLFQLMWEWVDFDARVIRIPDEARGAANKGVPAVLPLSKRGMKVLATIRPKDEDNNIVDLPTGLILNTTANAVTCFWKDMQKDLGLKGLRWHDLRHEATSRLFEKGFHPLEVASITGHKSMQTLKRYTHLNAENLVARLG